MSIKIKPVDPTEFLATGKSFRASRVDIGFALWFVRIGRKMISQRNRE